MAEKTSKIETSFAGNSLRPVRFSIALISAASLAYEVLLMRLYSIIQWHHFAYMIISLALLGYGASGTFLALARSKLLVRFHQAYLANLILFTFSSLLCFHLAQAIPFNPEEFLWDTHQLVRLMVNYLLLAIPFFFAANSIGLALMRYRQNAARVYAADLVGAGIGSLGIVILLFWVFPHTALKIIGGLGVAAALIALFELRSKLRIWYGFILLAAIFSYLVPAAWLKPVPLSYKALSQTLQITGTRVVREYTSPLGLLSLVESPVIPFRYAPGMSLRGQQEPPVQLGLFTDADNMTAITRFRGNLHELEFLDQFTSALPYHLGNPKQILVVGAGGGSSILQAKLHQTESIETVELNPQVINLVANEYSEFAGGLYSSPDTMIRISEARGYVSQRQKRFDLIQIALLDSFNASSAGLYALNESYLYTVEAFQEYVAHLKPGGYLAVTRWVKMPPRDTLKLFATAFEALKQTGIGSPKNQLLLIRGWQTSTLLVKNGEVGEAEIASLKEFCHSRNFDVAYYPGIQVDEANRFNVFSQPYFYVGTKAIVAGEREREEFFDHYKFDLRPATDDRPYFFHFFKWRVLPEILNLRGSGGIPLLESGYLVLLATFVQAMIVSVILILVPLCFHLSGMTHYFSVADFSRIFIYFSSLGLAFLFIEIALIQKFILFLHHPLYSMTVVLSSFLFFAGVGSRCVPRLLFTNGFRTVALKSVSGIAIIGVIYLIALENIFALLIGSAIAIKVMIAVLLIAPLGFFMGMPFPLALTRLGDQAPALIPWAWGINGCASVISAVLGTLTAIHFGFTLLVVVAICLYGLAVLSFPVFPSSYSKRTNH